MNRLILGVLIVVIALALILPGCSVTPSPTTTQAPATSPTPKPATSTASEFYKGKTIIIYVPSAPGGTFDLISRVMGPYLEKYTGASAQIANSQNIEAQNKLAASKPDGLSVILSGHGPKEITGQLFKQAGVAFDWTKFVLLGRIPFSSSAIVFDKKLNWTKVSDPVGKDFLIAATTPFFEPLFAEALGWDKAKIIPGMSGPDKALALRRGEVQAAAFGAAQLSQNTDVAVAVVITTRDEKGFPGIPTVTEVAVKGKEKWAKWASSWDEVMYWSYAAPGTPQDRGDYLEAALAQMYKDPAFVADMAKIKIDLSPKFVTSRELSAITSTLAALSPDDIKEMQNVIEKKYAK
jgi:tripartite-type tricarboxylate transporter receptor subunit TctC